MASCFQTVHSKDLFDNREPNTVAKTQPSPNETFRKNDICINQFLKSIFFGNSISKEINLPSNANDMNDVCIKRFWDQQLLDIREPIKMPIHKYSMTYNMNFKNRGMALIFGLSDKDGMVEDCNAFKALLKLLQFNVTVYNDCSADEIADELKIVAEMNHSSNDCILIAVFMHGDNKFLYANDKKFCPEDLWEPFTADKCPTLAGKPKLIFIQACLKSDNLSENFAYQMNLIDHQPTFPQSEISKSNEYYIPIYSDILIHYSIIHGEYLLRKTKEETSFIKAVCAIFQMYAKQFDLVTLLTLVNQVVATQFELNMGKEMPIPCLISMLTRKMYF